jgi:hypothetical protein
MDPAAQSDRRRLARLAFYLIIAGGLFLLLRTWHGRAIDIEIVHHFPSGDQYLPAEVEIQLWDGTTLLTDSYFPHPDSIQELESSARVPAGDYRVTFSIMHPYGHREMELTHDLHVEEAGRYTIDYE